MENKAVLTGRERFFDQDEIIVSKTDLKGHIQYANRVFMRVGAFDDHEVMGGPPFDFAASGHAALCLQIIVG